MDKETFVEKMLLNERRKRIHKSKQKNIEATGYYREKRFLISKLKVTKWKKF